MSTQFTSYCNSPVGLIKIVAEEDVITMITFEEEGHEQVKNPNKYTESCAVQLEEYFKGDRKEFNLTLRPKGTPFQESVWNQLQKIPFGKTVSYLFIAKQLGDEKSVRAVGTANGSNPIAIIVPCHRVIGSNNKLVGYSGGLWRKKWLLEHEEIVKGERMF